MNINRRKQELTGQEVLDIAEPLVRAWHSVGQESEEAIGRIGPCGLDRPGEGLRRSPLGLTAYDIRAHGIVDRCLEAWSGAMRRLFGRTPAEWRHEGAELLMAGFALDHGYRIACCRLLLRAQLVTLSRLIVAEDRRTVLGPS